MLTRRKGVGHAAVWTIPSALAEEDAAVRLHRPPPVYFCNILRRYGPPPSYPGMKIPGLNAAIPSGAQWGMQYAHAAAVSLVLCVAVLL